MSKKNNDQPSDQTVSISSINVDQTMGMEEAAQMALEKKQSLERVIAFSPDGYSNLVEIGKGGMGKIYSAKQDSLNRNVAIKVMHFPDDKEGVQRFMMEASILAQLDHPNIIRVFDFGQSDGMMFLVMELIDGDTLKQHVLQHGPLSAEDFLLIAKQMTGAILESHRQNIVHRDIKPSNILLKIRDETIISKLIDFGLVKHLSQNLELSRTGSVLGSPLYMSPEQLLNEKIDDRTDIYALGLTFYFLLTGLPPYKAKEILALFRSQLEEEPEKLTDVRPDLKKYPAISWMVETMFQKKPDNRFQNAQQLKECITQIEKMMLTGQHTGLCFQDGQIVPTDNEGATSSEHSVKKEETEKNSEQVSNDGATPIKESEQFTLEPTNPHIQQQTFVDNRSDISQSLSGLQGQVQQQKSQWPILLAVVILLFGMFLYTQQNTKNMLQQQANQVESDVEVLLSSDPSDVEIFQQNTYVGQTPQSFNLKSEETMSLTLKKEGYEDRVIEINSKIKSPLIKLQKKKPTVEKEPEKVIPKQTIKKETKVPGPKKPTKKKKTVPVKKKQEKTESKKGLKLKTNY